MEMVVAEYAKTLLEGNEWNPDKAKDALLDRSIKAVADGKPIKEVWRRSLDVAAEMPSLVDLHNVEALNRCQQEKRSRPESALEVQGITPELVRNRWGELWQGSK